MSFHTSCKNMRLDRLTFLTADCLDSTGRYCPSEIDLDLVLGNMDGKFAWGQDSFSSSSRQVELVDGRFLRARLEDSEGELQDTKVDLGEHISNDNGNLRLYGLQIKSPTSDDTDDHQNSFSQGGFQPQLMHSDSAGNDEQDDPFKPKLSGDSGSSQRGFQPTEAGFRQGGFQHSNAGFTQEGFRSDYSLHQSDHGSTQGGAEGSSQAA